ncbi:thioredoxin [Streptomyces telluris]|uniref:Thioredoxin n=1 Tax=Streptomyces telluris TaxID=2720021 RepID=A0A9X2LPJ4_9ACTN|nr:thioredoxin [Streptomyces telluris]MCQ8774656.1 thioredoxin [Streptomyces telluris]NJP77382.1 thioredoxin [Streptomyces telluris]
MSSSTAAGTTAGTTAAAAVAGVTDATFAAEVLDERLPVLVEFTADWCPPCRMIAPVLADLAEQEAGRLKIVALDVDANPQTQAAYGVLSMPTLMLFRAGEPVASLVGARSKARLLRDLDGLLD